MAQDALLNSEEGKMRTESYNELENEFVTLLKTRSLIPIVGSGFTRLCNCHKGKVPSGSDMKKDMIDSLVSIDFATYDQLKTVNFSKIAYYYNKNVADEIRKKYLRDNFTEVEITDDRLGFLSVNWKYIYTLNIDDGIENNSKYKTTIAPMRSFSDELINTENCVIKIHGDATEMYKYETGESLSVLGIDQYIRSLKDNKFILNQLQHDYACDNILFIGCSLDDEVDLMKTFLEIPDKLSNGVYPEVKHRYYVTDKLPSKMQVCDLESYGIDTIVLVDNYNNFYASFLHYDEEANRITPQQIDIHSKIEFEAEVSGKSVNEKYFFKGKKLYDPKTNKISFPMFFIKRNIYSDLEKSAIQNTITLLCGTRVSGKSYALAYLAYSLHDRIVYYFDSRSNIYKNDFDYLLGKNQVTLVFDTNVLKRDSVKQLINSCDILSSKSIHVVIAINRSDRDILSYVEAQENGNINILNINNKLNDNEFDAINKKLAKIPLIPLQKNNFTILDNLLLCAHQALKQHQNGIAKIRIRDEYTLAIYIMLATYEKIDDQQLVNLHLINESAAILQGRTEEIEDYYLFPYEKTIYNNSSHRIICNASFWLVSQLSEYAEVEMHENIINNSYKYIVQTILDNSASETKGFKEIEELIKFDNLNMIFNSNKKGARATIQNIYASLSEILSNSYQYHHQYAKCLLWSENSSEEILDLALSHAKVALQQVQRDKEKKNILKKDHPLNIAEAHIRFTISMIYAIVCNNENFQKMETIENVIDAMYEMVGSPFNMYAISKIRASSENHPLKRTYYWLVKDCDLNRYNLNKMKNKVDVIVNTIFKSNYHS